MKLVIKHCLKSGGAMRQYCEIVAVKKIDFVIKPDVKDIHERDIFDIFFCLINVNHFIRGPPYQFRFLKI